MSQIQTKFIADDAVTSAKIPANAVGGSEIRLANNVELRARNAANSADINLVKVDGSDIAQLLVQFRSAFTPSNANDVANKTYVDTAVSGSVQVAKQSVTVVSQSNLTLSGEQTIDGVLTSASRILVAGQTAGAENGIYVTAAGAWARSTDADSSAEVLPGMLVYVASGTSYGETIWALDNLGAITLDTTALVFKNQTKKPNYESLTLDGTDITNQYKDLAFLIEPNSLQLFVQGIKQELTDDYTLSTVGSITRLSFAGGLATGGASELVASDKLRVHYRY